MRNDLHKLIKLHKKKYGLLMEKGDILYIETHTKVGDRLVIKERKVRT